jgi:aminoglycoside phosphotransferase (APT) family kinase protein
VVIVVFALFVAGTLGVTWIRRSHPAEPVDGGDASPTPVDGGAVPSALPSADNGATLVAQDAMRHLAAVAAREAAESAEARREADMLRRDLADCDRERTRLTNALAQTDADRIRLAARLEAFEQHGRRS